MVEQGGYKTLELGLRKSFFDKKLSLNLQAYDVFNWVREKITLETNNISYIKKTDILESRYITLTINYRFHNYKKKYRGGDAAGDDKQRL
jgi:hypothetical protein